MRRLEIGRDESEGLVEPLVRRDVGGRGVLVEFLGEDRPELGAVDELARDRLGRLEAADGRRPAARPRRRPGRRSGWRRGCAGAVVVGATVGAGRALDDGDVAVDGEVVADPHAATSSIAARIRAAGEDGRRACRVADMGGIVARVSRRARRPSHDVAFLIACPLDPERRVPTVFLGRTRKRFYPSLPRPGVPIGQALPVFLFVAVNAGGAQASPMRSLAGCPPVAHAPWGALAPLLAVRLRLGPPWRRFSVAMIDALAGMLASAFASGAAGADSQSGPWVIRGAGCCVRIGGWK